REAAEAKTRVLIRIADSQGRERTVEMLPATLNAGRVRGTVTSTGAEASLSIARIISVDPAAPPADGALPTEGGGTIGRESALSPLASAQSAPEQRPRSNRHRKRPTTEHSG